MSKAQTKSTIEIYPREGTETRLAGGQVPLYQLLKFIPVRGRKPVGLRSQQRQKSLKFIPERGRRRGVQHVLVSRFDGLKFIPMRGRKLNIISLVDCVVVVEIYPREGTETIMRPRVKSL